MKELKRITAQVKVLVEKYGYKSEKSIQIRLAMETTQLGDEVVERSQIFINGGHYIYADGDSFKTALQRLEIRLKDREPETNLLSDSDLLS